jgi:hypothetical protein
MKRMFLEPLKKGCQGLTSKTLVPSPLKLRRQIGRARESERRAETKLTMKSLTKVEASETKREVGSWRNLRINHRFNKRSRSAPRIPLVEPTSQRPTGPRTK